LEPIGSRAMGESGIHPSVPRSLCCRAGGFLPFGAMHLPPSSDVRPRALARGALLAATVLTGALLCATPETARAVEPLQQHDVVLLQSGQIIEQRVDGGADAMAAYVKRLGDAATEAMRATPQQIPTAGFIVVAVRPAGQTHVWFDFKPALGDQATAALAHVVETVPPATVKSGDVVFALRVSIWGAKPPAAYAPAPQEWRDAAKKAGHKLEIDALVDQLWPR
jgi:hypothetical protein